MAITLGTPPLNHRQLERAAEWNEPVARTALDELVGRIRQIRTPERRRVYDVMLEGLRAKLNDNMNIVETRNTISAALKMVELQIKKEARKEKFKKIFYCFCRCFRPSQKVSPLPSPAMENMANVARVLDMNE